MDKYSKIFYIALCVNSLTLLLNALNNMIWKSDTVMWISGIIELICIPLMVFSSMKMWINKK